MMCLKCLGVGSQSPTAQVAAEIQNSKEDAVNALPRDCQIGWLRLTVHLALVVNLESCGPERRAAPFPRSRVTELKASEIETKKVQL
jgi:hypothetical protein